MENEETKKLVMIGIDDGPIFCFQNGDDCWEESIDRYGFSNVFYLFPDHIECVICSKYPKFDPSDVLQLFDPYNYGWVKEIYPPILNLK